MDRSSDSAQVSGQYLQRGNAAFDAQLATRSLEDGGIGGWLSPYLRPGMRLLDCGCGPGTMTLGFAHALAPGEVVGIDIDPKQVEAAKRQAGDEPANLRFEQADVYALPFPDGSFDFVFAQTVFMYLRDPLRALAEIKRVLTPQGMVAIADPDRYSTVMYPPDPVIVQANQLYNRARDLAGSSPYEGRQYRAMLHDAGFARSSIEVYPHVTGSDEVVEARVAYAKARWGSPLFVNTVIEQGWLQGPEVKELQDGVEQWYRHPDVFSCTMLIRALGWKEGERDAP